MPVTIRFDPFATLVAAFETLWPDTACDVVIGGLDQFPNSRREAVLLTRDSNTGTVMAMVSADRPIVEAASALAVALARIAVGPKANAAQHAEAHEALCAEYLRRAMQSGVVEPVNDLPAGARLQ